MKPHQNWDQMKRVSYIGPPSSEKSKFPLAPNWENAGRTEAPKKTNRKKHATVAPCTAEVHVTWSKAPEALRRRRDGFVDTWAPSTEQRLQVARQPDTTFMGVEEKRRSGRIKALVLGLFTLKQRTTNVKHRNNFYSSSDIHQVEMWLESSRASAGLWIHLETSGNKCQIIRLTDDV